MSDDGDEHVHPGKGKSPSYCLSMLNQKGASVFQRTESEQLTDEMHSLGQQLSSMRDCIASLFDEQAGLRSKTHAAVQLATTCENTVYASVKSVGDIHRTLFEFVDPRNLKKFVSEIVEEELTKLEKKFILELRELRNHVTKKRTADADADSTTSKVAKSSKQVEIEEQIEGDKILCHHLACIDNSLSPTSTPTRAIAPWPPQPLPALQMPQFPSGVTSEGLFEAIGNHLQQSPSEAYSLGGVKEEQSFEF